MFDDPVVGPQLALGALSAGIGLLTAQKPKDVNSALQGGLGSISQALLYGGQQQQKLDVEQAEVDRRKSAADQFMQMVEGNRQPPPPGPAPARPRPTYTPGQGMPPYAPAPPMAAPMAAPGPGPGGSQGGGSPMADIPPQALPYIRYAIENPDQASFVNPIIAQMMTPRKKTKNEELLELAGITQGSETAKRFALMNLGLSPTIDQTATERYRQQLDEDRNAGLAIQERGQGLTAASQAQTVANQAATRRLEEAKFAFEKNKPPPMTDFDRKMAAANMPPGSEAYLAAAQANVPQREMLPIEKSLIAEGVDLGSEEGMAALRKARPGEGPTLAEQIAGLNEIPRPVVTAEDGGTPISNPPPPAPPPTDAPPVTPVLAPGDPGYVYEDTPDPVSTLGEMADVRLEKRLGPEKANALRGMLAGITDPVKQRRAQGVLRRLAKGTLGINNAAAELMAMEQK